MEYFWDVFAVLSAEVRPTRQSNMAVSLLTWADALDSDDLS